MYTFDENRDGMLNKVEAYSMGTGIMSGEITEKDINRVLNEIYTNGKFKKYV